MARARRAVGVLSAALVLAGTAACGGPSAPAASRAASPAAPPTALATPTDRSPHGVLLSAQLGLHAARRARFGYQQPGRDDVQGMLFWAPKTALELRRPDGSDQLIVLDTTAYVAAPEGGRHWEKFAAAGARPGGPYALLVDRLNPVVALNAAVAAPDVELVGEERLQSAAVQHYRVVTTVAAYAEAQRDLPADRRQALRDALGAGGVTALTLDLWLSDHDLPVELHLSGGGAVGRLDDTLRYSDFGAPLSVQAPAEDDTYPAGPAAPPPLP